MNAVPNLEDLEAGNIQHTDEVLSLVLRVQSLVDTGDQPREHFAVDGLGQGSDRVNHLIHDKISLQYISVSFMFAYT